VLSKPYAQAGDRSPLQLLFGAAGLRAKKTMAFPRFRWIPARQEQSETPPSMLKVENKLNSAKEIHYEPPMGLAFDK